MDLKQLNVAKGPASNADVTVSLTVEDLTAISGKTLTVGDALTQGKLQITGNAELASKLAEVI